MIVAFLTLLHRIRRKRVIHSFLFFVVPVELIKEWLNSDFKKSLSARECCEKIC